MKASLSFIVSALLTTSAFASGFHHEVKRESIDSFGNVFKRSEHALEKQAAAVDGLAGYATLNGGTKGGKGGKTTTVKTLSALRAAVKGNSAKIVYIDGIIKGDKAVVDVGSYTTILGANANSGMTNGGFRLNKVSNVIIRGLKLSKSPAPTDLIGVQGKSTNIWIDHCQFESDLAKDKDFYDGQLDISHGSDFITVSWNVFTNSWKTSLIGHSDNNGSEDKGRLRVTYHHNYFYNLNSRLPSIRFGTAHIYNNLYASIKASAINSRLGAQVLVEGNYFDGVQNPIETTLEGGYAVAKNNVFVNSDEPDLKNKGSLTSVPYSYSLDSASSVPGIVKKSAGVSALKF